MPTLTRASDKFVHMAISSLVVMSGYRFLLKVASSSANCCDVKCVLCRLCRLPFLPSLSSVSTPGETTVFVNSCLTSIGVRTPAKFSRYYFSKKILLSIILNNDQAQTLEFFFYTYVQVMTIDVNKIDFPKNISYEKALFH